MATENYWKMAGTVLVGGLAGVGAIALSPFFGGALAITGVGAVVGSVVGGGAGAGFAFMNDGEEQTRAEVDKAREEGRNEAKAEYLSIREALEKKLRQYEQHVQQQNAVDDLTLAMYGIGVASLVHCRVATKENLLGLKEFAFGAAHEHLPRAVLDDIARIETSSPTLAGAHARAFAVAPGSHDLFMQMVDVAASVADPDGTHRLSSIWSQLRAA